MRIIAFSRLKEFWQSRRDDRDRAERDLAAWYKVAKNAEWVNFGELKQTFGSADQVENCVVFDVGNNRFRLIGRVFYVKDLRAGRIYVLRVMDHKEYDKQTWIDSCGCHKPPPPKSAGSQASRHKRRRR